MDKIDKLINNRLESRWGDKLERRDYYQLEIEKEFLKGKGKTSGIMFLVDVDSSHYIDINLYKSGLIKMVFRRDDFELIEIHCNKENVNNNLNALLLLIDEYLLTMERFRQISKGNIPTDIVRYNKVNKILED
jgi:hypothetical protein